MFRRQHQPVQKSTTPPRLPPRDSGRRRDRRGRGPRGPLLPPGLPGALSRADRFDEHVRATLARLQRNWERRLARTEVAVAPVPPSDNPSWEPGVPLARAFPAADGLPDRIVLYRRPIEARAVDSRDLGLLILDVVVEQLGHLWRMPPEEVDPGFNRPTDWD
ncbi:MAG: metallopeptidase family protein [Bifidobacteriaceae bacterium]|nr:metallopeptidase family protein [Bifidobacteriaceae bacterium]